MGYKHHGGHHRGGHSLPDDHKCNATMWREDHELLKKYAEKRKIKMVEALHQLMEIGGVNEDTHQ